MLCVAGIRDRERRKERKKERDAVRLGVEGIGDREERREGKGRSEGMEGRERMLCVGVGCVGRGNEGKEKGCCKLRMWSVEGKQRWKKKKGEEGSEGKEDRYKREKNKERAKESKYTEQGDALCKMTLSDAG